jgi:hypothetical protein
MVNKPITHYVFVDLENVPRVDVGPAAGHPVHVTLLIGKHQKSFGLELLRAAKLLGDRLELVEVGATGHNALDLTLAYYLGRAAEAAPKATFSIVSNDEDFDPLIAHLRAKGINVSRQGSFAGPPFLPVAKKITPAEPAAPVPALHQPKPPAAPKPRASPKPKLAADKLDKFIEHLRNSPPANRTKLEHMITAYFKPSLPAGGMKGVIAELQRRKVVEIDSSGTVVVFRT